MTNEIERAEELATNSDELAKEAVLKACEELETLRRARAALEQINQELTTHVND